MARTKAEVISEMVDSGLFSDDEIRAAVKGSPAAEQKPSLAKRAWDAAAVPEQKAREGLQMIADTIKVPEPTGNLPLDLARGFKPTVEKSFVEALGKVAPSFVSREALAFTLAGQGGRLAKPILRPVLQGIGRQGESVSGAVPGSLEAAYKDASLMGAKGKKAVNNMYEKAKTAGGDVRDELKEISDPKEFVDKALQFAKDKTLTPLEGLEARKTLQTIKRRVTDQFFRTAKDKFDAVAKTVFAGEDAAHKRAVMAESLRSIAPQNKYGGTSAFKMGIQAMASSDSLPGKLLALGISPVVQGLAATGAGVAARTATSPRVSSSLGALMNAVSSRSKRKK